MNLVKLNLDTLKLVKTLLDDPSQAIPHALKTLAPNSHWDLLTQKVGSNLAKVDEAELTLPLFDKSVADDGILSGDWKWSASVETNASLAIDLLTDEDLTNLPIQPDAGHTLVVYGGSIAAGGQLGAKADNFPWGTVGIDASGKRSADIRWFIQAKDNESLLSALDEAKDHFVWPYDLQAMLRLAGRTDWFGMEYELDGEAQLAIEVDASKAATGWTFSLDGDTSSVGLSFGVKGGFKALRSSRWKLTVMVEPRIQAGVGTVLGLRIKLHDLMQSRRNASIELAAAADFSAVATSAERVLRATWPEIKNSAQLNALTLPGSAIADQLKELIEENFDGYLEQLSIVLVGGQPTSDLRDALVGKLTLGLAEVLDGLLGELAAGQVTAEEALSKWLEHLLGQDMAALADDTKIKAVITDALGKAKAGIEDAIGDLNQKIVGKTEEEVDSMLKSLGELGARFDKNIHALDDNALSMAIRDALERYAKARDEFLAKLSDSQRQKLSLSLSSTFSRDTSSEAAFDAWFRPDATVTPEAEKLFNMLCGGKLLALPELVQAASVSGAISDAKGWLLSTTQVLNEQRVTLNFFGVKISNSISWLKNVSVQTDLVTGDLLALKGEGGIKTAIANPWKNRSALLGVQLELIDGENGAKRRLAASLNGAFTAYQEKTKRTKIQDLLNAYSDATGGQRCDIGLLLDLPPSSDAEGTRRFWNELTIAVPVALDVKQWDAFSRLDSSWIEKVSSEFALKQFQRRYVTDSLFSDDPLGDLLDDANRAGETTILSFLKRFPKNHVSLFSAADAATKLNMEVTSQTFDPGVRRFMAYQRLAATVQAPLRLRNLAIEAVGKIEELPINPDPVAVRKLLEPFLTRIQYVLEPVALVSETWLGIGALGAKDEPVAWPFVSFITTMASLTGIPVPPGFVPIALVGNGPAVRLITAS